MRPMDTSSPVAQLAWYVEYAEELRAEGDRLREALRKVPMAEVTEKAILDAIELWYSANYPTGVRLKGIDRMLLAKYIAQRVGATPIESVGSFAPVAASPSGDTTGGE